MGATEFQAILQALAQGELSSDEVARLQHLLATIAEPGRVFALIEQAAQGKGCPRRQAHRHTQWHA